MIGVGLVGCGLIGKKRAASLGSRASLVACADKDIEKAKSVAINTSSVFKDYQSLLKLPEIEAVIIATTHDSLAEITFAAIQAGKHVLVEKPAARNIHELVPILNFLTNSDIKVHVGFNLRYHRAIRKAKDLIKNGALGELMFLRARYGHGGRIGYDSEWRADPDLSGGGELIDQGPHLTDLSRWIFEEEFTEIQGFAHTYFWNMPVDDNGFMLLKTPKQKTAFLHVSCSEWKNIFSMEIYGKQGKLEIFGLGGSYGVERLTYYKMLPEMGPPETTSWEYPMEDDSWAVELDEFFQDIRLNRQPTSSINDAYESLKIIRQVYRDSGYDHCT